MSDWKAKRFWDTVTVDEADKGYAILLDGRPVRTPSKTQLIVPTTALAEVIQGEWQAQEDVIDPLSMPFTRSANSAIDKVSPQRKAVAQMLAEYGESDLLCYRATDPRELVARQSEALDPILDWVAARYEATLNVAQGVMHIAQPQASTQKLADEIHKLDAFEMAGFHDLVIITGSLVLALAVIDDHLSPDDAWTLSRIDESWQIEQWGEDDEASRVAEAKRLDLTRAAEFFFLSRDR